MSTPYLLSLGALHILARRHFNQGHTRPSSETSPKIREHTFNLLWGGGGGLEDFFLSDFFVIVFVLSSAIFLIRDTQHGTMLELPGTTQDNLFLKQSSDLFSVKLACFISEATLSGYAGFGTSTVHLKIPEHDASAQCWFNVGPPSTTLAQH